MSDIPAFLDHRNTGGPPQLGEDNKEREAANRTDESATASINGASPTPITTSEFPSALDIVTKYLEYRDFVEDASKKFAKFLAPYREAMEVLEGGARELMKLTGQKALSTEAGTAFQSPGLRVRCEDVKAFHDWVFRYEQRDFLTAHVSKDAVSEYMDKVSEGHPPPGIKVEPYVNINFRRK